MKRTCRFVAPVLESLLLSAVFAGFVHAAELIAKSSLTAPEGLAAQAGIPAPNMVDAFYNSFLDPTQWTLHTQATTVSQGNFAFHAPYAGPNSLSSTANARTSFTSTEFIGRRLWTGGSVYFNPEYIAGQGLSRTLGIAGFPNGEVYRVDDPSFKLVLSRLYFQQIWGLSQETEHMESGQNQLAGDVSKERITFAAGKFSLTDFFDHNSYSADQRNQFLNWALFTNGAWDYAADTRGYTYGIYGEYNQERWAIRAASVMEPKQPNQETMETRVGRARGDQLEGEWRYAMGDHPGTLRLLGYANQSHAGEYSTALSLSPVNPDVAQTRDYRTKYGFGLNMEQAITSDLGFFSRAGWNNGTTETWAFTTIDRTASAGFSLKGNRWSRPEDTIGLAVVVNGLSPEHRAYLAAGGLDFIIGDGALNYAPEQIIETYYAFHFWRYWTITTDFQGVKNPAYNADRGPVLVMAERVHIQF
jgi:high affinity Mn2+ porin